jgi:hypothetical protein
MQFSVLGSRFLAVSFQLSAFGGWQFVFVSRGDLLSISCSLGSFASLTFIVLP